MSLESKLRSYYTKNATQADMHGWGLSGGRAGKTARRTKAITDDNPVSTYEREVKKAVSMSGMGLNQGPPAYLNTDVHRFKYKGIPGNGLSGGSNRYGYAEHFGNDNPMHVGFQQKYPGSFPMPGFYPNSDGAGLSGGHGIMTGGYRPAYMGGMMGGSSKAKKVKNPARVAAGKAAAAKSDWLRKVAAYRKETGASQKDAFKALGRK